MLRTIPLLLALILAVPSGAQEPEAAAPTPAVALPDAPMPEGVESFQIAFELQAGNDVALERVGVELDLPSGAVVLPLVDDGSVPEDMPWDGIFVGIWRGPFLRWAHVRLLAGSQGAPEVLAESLERFHDQQRAHVAWRLVQTDSRIAAVRTASTPLVATDDVQGRVELLASFGWAALLALFLGTLAMRARGRRP